MRTTRFSETEIIYTVKQVEMGISVKEIARKYGVCENTVYRWRRKYDGLSPSELRRLKELERENSQLKKLVAELSLDKEILQDVLRTNIEVNPPWGNKHSSAPSLVEGLPYFRRVVPLWTSTVGVIPVLP